MNLRKMLMIGVAALATSAFVSSAASARYYHRYHHHYRGYGAYDQYRPTGPASLNFQNGSGWNNGHMPSYQYGHPDHW